MIQVKMAPCVLEMRRSVNHISTATLLQAKITCVMLSRENMIWKPWRNLSVGRDYSL